MKHNILKISVVVCAYNEEKTIEHCLTSLIDQNFSKEYYEIIIIDDESIDSTGEKVLDLIGKNKNVSLRYYKVEHIGLSGARNTGVKRAKSQIIAFIDGDAYADPEWLKNIVEGFQKPDVDIVSGRVKNYNPNKKRFSNFIYQSHFKSSVDASPSKITGTNMAFRKKVFNENIIFLDTFTARGDETYVVQKYFLENPNKKESFIEGGIVYNQHPEYLNEWLSQQFIEGKCGRRIHQILNNKKNDKINFIFRFLSITFLPHIFFSVITNSSNFYLFTHFLIFSTRNLYKFNYFKHAWKNSYKNFGFSSSMLAIFILISGTLTSDFGQIIESLFGEKKNLLSSSISKILFEKTSL